VSDDQPSTSHADDEKPAAREQGKLGFGDLRHYVPADLLNVSFPIAVRGYSREAVDAYVKRANRVIAELKVSASPRAAVTHALEQTEEQVSGLLQRARETGEQITESASAEGEQIVAKAKAEAAELMVSVSTEADRVKDVAGKELADARAQAEDLLERSRLEAESTRAKAEEEAEQRRRRLDEELTGSREQAEARMRELQDDTGEVWSDRDRLLVDVRRMASELLALADGAALRQTQDEPEEVDDVERAGTEVVDEVSPEAQTEVRKPKKPARSA
jgi:DivIVA domain-containing protein